MTKFGLILTYDVYYCYVRIHYNLRKIVPCKFGVKDAIETMMLQQRSLGLYEK